jgi:hypothetical protein
MATQKRITLSPKLATDVRTVVDRVLGQGSSSATTPYQSDSTDRWLKVKTVTGGGAPYVYTVDIYTSPYSTTPISEGLAKARSVQEIGGSGGPVEVNSYHKIIGRAKVDGDFCFLFSPGGASLPTAQYVEMHFKMVTNNQSGWDRARLHPPLN